MPIYTYRCQECGIQFERTQKFSDTPLKHCPECDKDTLRKVYTPVGVVFKGSGFYSTDNRSSPGAGRSTGQSSENDKPSDNGAESTKSGDKSSNTKTKKTESKSS